MFPSEEGNESSNSAIYPRKTGLTLKIWLFMSRIVLLDPKLTPPPRQFQQLSSTGKFFIFKIFGMRKEQQQPPWLINFAKIWSEHVLRNKNYNSQVWAWLSKKFLIGNFEFGYPGIWAPPLGLIGLREIGKRKVSPRIQLLVADASRSHYPLRTVTSLGCHKQPER